MAEGYLTNSAAVSSIGTSFALAKLITLDTMDAVSQAAGIDFIPPGAIVSHVKLQAENASGVTSFSVAGWQDADGDDLWIGPSQTAQDGVAGLTSTSELSAIIPADDIVNVLEAATRAAKKVYLSVHGDASTFDIPIGGVKVYWHTADTDG